MVAANGAQLEELKAEVERHQGKHWEHHNCKTEMDIIKASCAPVAWLPRFQTRALIIPESAAGVALRGLSGAGLHAAAERRLRKEELCEVSDRVFVF